MNLLKGKVDHLLEAIHAMTRREEELHQDALRNVIPYVISASVLPLVVTTLVYGIPPGYTPRLEGNSIPQPI